MAGVLLPHTKGGVSAVLEPDVPEDDPDLGLIKDAADIVGNQTSSEQQHLRLSAEAPNADLVLVPVVASWGGRIC